MATEEIDQGQVESGEEEISLMRILGSWVGKTFVLMMQDLREIRGIYLGHDAKLNFTMRDCTLTQTLPTGEVRTSQFESMLVSRNQLVGFALQP